MSRRPPFAAHVEPTPHPSALAAAVVMALLLAACGTSGSTSTRWGAPAGASPSAAPIAAVPSPSPTPRPRPTAEPLPSAAHRPQTIHIVGDGIWFTTTPVLGCSSTARCVGNQVKGAFWALEWASHEKVGTILAKCVMTVASRNMYDCAITVKLTGRGDIIFDESIVEGGNGPQGPWPILSGTGEFLGATGSAGIPADSTCHCGNWVIAITG